MCRAAAQESTQKLLKLETTDLPTETDSLWSLPVHSQNGSCNPCNTKDNKIVSSQKEQRFCGGELKSQQGPLLLGSDMCPPVRFAIIRDFRHDGCVISGSFGPCTC